MHKRASTRRGICLYLAEVDEIGRACSIRKVFERMKKSRGT